MVSCGVLTCAAGNTIGTENVSLDTFSVLALVSVPIFAPNILIPAFAEPSMPEASVTVTATSNANCSIGRISSSTVSVFKAIGFGKVGLTIAPLSSSDCSSLTASVISATAVLMNSFNSISSYHSSESSTIAFTNSVLLSHTPKFICLSPSHAQIIFAPFTDHSQS